MIYIRGHALDYDEWERLGNRDWSFESCLPFFKKSEKNQRGASRYHGDAGPLYVSDAAEVNELTERYVDAAREAGLPHNPDFNGESQEGAGVYQATLLERRRWSAADAFLKPALERPNLRVLTGALVERIELEGARAVGLVCRRRGVQRRVRTRREVVLSAGAIGSPHLLLRSGIGPADELRSAGVEVRVDLPGVGKNLQDHIHAPVIMETLRFAGICPPRAPHQWLDFGRHLGAYVLRRRSKFASILAEGGGFARLPGHDGRPNVQYHFGPGYICPPPGMPPSVWAYSILPCVLRPQSRGEVRLKSAAPKDPPIIDPGYLSAEADVQTIVEGLKQAREISHAEAFGRHRGRELKPGPAVRTDAELTRYVRDSGFSVHHAAGTCRMGAGDDAVVDDRLRVRGVEGLRVVDASIMPRLVGGNTNAPTMMIAERAAAWMTGLA